KRPVVSRSGTATQRRFCRITHASTHKDSAKLIEIERGRAAIREDGSNCMCQVATFSAHSRSSRVATASGCHMVNIEAKPSGTTRDKSGMTITFAESPVIDSRWKYEIIGSARPNCTQTEIINAS